MIRDAGDRLEVSGAMTLATARRLAQAGIGMLGREQVVFDLAQVHEVDSSSLTVVFAWARAARAQGKRIVISNPPQNMLSLAELYGVTELLPLA
ncbi:MAG: STAS domain-containing protein [Pseudomonadota bacterium]